MAADRPKTIGSRIILSGIDLSWYAGAECRRPGADESVFFPPVPGDPDFSENHSAAGKATIKRYAKAKVICDSCPVRPKCLNHALTIPESEGYWGGMSPDERRQEKRRRQRAAAKEREETVSA